MLKYFLFIIYITITLFLYCQKSKVLNYRKFDQKWIHFGFMLGGNIADFNIQSKANKYSLYQVKSIENKRQTGGQLGVLTDIKLFTPLLRLRFIPSLSFQERVINYIIYNPNKPSEDKINEERINSTNLDFPLLLQFRALRYNNFGVYTTGGIQFSYDLQSQAKANQSLTDPFIKLKAQDMYSLFGFGLEFYAVYFKCNIELKYANGLNNVFIQDNTPVSLPIESIKNKTWLISIIFEG